MNFLEAVKTGLPMRRPHWNSYREPLTGSVPWSFLQVQELLAEDWEVKLPEAEKILLTKEQIKDAYLRPTEEKK